MVSKRNYIIIGIIMAVILFLFQFTGVARTALSSYGSNPYASPDVKALTSGKEAFSPDAIIKKGDAYVIYVGKDKATGEVVKQWAKYTKRKLTTEKAISKVKFKNGNPDVVIIDSAVLGVDDASYIADFAQQGVGVVFCGYPDNSLMTSPELRDILGIMRVEGDSVKLHGAYLFGDLLLGGDIQYEALKPEDEKYQDLTMEVPWVHPAAGTKTYMRGIPEDDSVKMEDYPSIIWRNSYGNSYVFVVGNDYMQKATGLGILTGTIAEMNSYSLYPIVNAQNLVFADYPYLASENEETIDKYYSRTTAAVFRDIVWTGIGAVQSRSDFGLTCMLAPQLDYTDDIEPSEDNLSYYMRLMEEKGIETGISDGNVSDLSLSDKLDADRAFWTANMPDYAFSSFYGADITDEEILKALNKPLLGQVQTVVKGYDGSPDIVSYITDDVTAQRAISDGIGYTYSEDFLVRSIEAALGYTSIAVDMGAVAFPQDESDLWENYYDELSGNILTFWGKKYNTFDATTASNCDLKIRNFLNLGYKHSSEENVISLDVTNSVGDSFFVLRLHDQQVVKVEGGYYKPIEDNVYLIKVDDAHADIYVSSPLPHFYKS